MRSTTRLRYVPMLVVLSACGPAVNSVMFLDPAPAPRPADHPIKIFADTRPECPVQEIGQVSSRKRNSLVSMEEVTESLRARAREMGGDAILGLSEETQTRGGTVVGNVIVANKDPVFSGIVVRFTDPNCTQ